MTDDAQRPDLAARPELSIVVFDSQAPVGTGQAVYMAATAPSCPESSWTQPPGLPRRGGPARRGPDQDARGRAGPVPLPPRRATVSQHWVLDPEVAPDQRTTVNP